MQEIAKDTYDVFYRIAIDVGTEVAKKYSWVGKHLTERLSTERAAPLS